MTRPYVIYFVIYAPVQLWIVRFVFDSVSACQAFFSEEVQGALGSRASEENLGIKATAVSTATRKLQL